MTNIKGETVRVHGLEKLYENSLSVQKHRLRIAAKDSRSYLGLVCKSWKQMGRVARGSFKLHIQFFIIKNCLKFDAK